MSSLCFTKLCWKPSQTKKKNTQHSSSELPHSHTYILSKNSRQLQKWVLRKIMAISGLRAFPKVEINDGIKGRLPYKREIKWHKTTEVLYTNCIYLYLWKMKRKVEICPLQKKRMSLLMWNCRQAFYFESLLMCGLVSHLRASTWFSSRLKDQSLPPLLGFICAFQELKGTR